MTIRAPPPPAGILVSDLHNKTYGSGSAALTALRDGQMRVGPGEVVGLVGQSVFDWNHGLHPDLTRLRQADRLQLPVALPAALPFGARQRRPAGDGAGPFQSGGLLADEPTAPLDSPRAMAVMDLLERLAGQMAKGVIVGPHDEKILPRLQRIDVVRDGVVGEGQRERVRDAPVRFRSRRLRNT